MRADARRARLEDALKHIHRCEEEGHLCTMDGLGQAVGIRPDEVPALADSLREAAYLTPAADSLDLTEEGRRYARRIVRSHRLWERFLADETALGPAEVHPRAERKEHRLTPEEVEALSERLGRPTHDPHGSPIPDAEGRLPDVPPPSPPPLSGTPLSRLRLGASATVVGISQECRGLTRRRFMDLGLTPGGRVKAEMAAPFGEPRAYRIRGTLIALRAEQAAQIFVRTDRT